MLKISKEIADSLPFDLATELQRYTQAKEAHRLTVDVPAPTSHAIVTEAYLNGGFLIESQEEQPKAVVLERPINLLKSEGLTLLEELERSSIEGPLQSIVSLLKRLFEEMPD
jgi:hypothetical protein